MRKFLSTRWRALRNGPPMRSQCSVGGGDPGMAHLETAYGRKKACARRAADDPHQATTLQCTCHLASPLGVCVCERRRLAASESWARARGCRLHSSTAPSSEKGLAPPRVPDPLATLAIATPWAPAPPQGPPILWVPAPAAPMRPRTWAPAAPATSELRRAHGLRRSDGLRRSKSRPGTSEAPATPWRGRPHTRFDADGRPFRGKRSAIAFVFGSIVPLIGAMLLCRRCF